MSSGTALATGTFGPWPRLQAMGVGPRRLRRLTSPGPRSRCQSCVRTAMRSTGSSHGRPRRGASWSCGPMPRGSSDHSPADVSIRSRVNEYGGGRCLPRAGRDAAGRSPTWTSPTSGCGFSHGPGAGTHRASGPVASDRRAPGRRGAQPRRAERHGGRRLGPGRARDPPSRRGPPGAEHRRAVDARGRALRARCSRATTSSGRRVAHRGEQLAVVAWDHPDMPWDASSFSSCRCRQACDTDTGTDEPTTLRTASFGRRVRHAGRRRSRRVGRAAGLATRRVTALRLGPARLVAALSADGDSGARAHADDRRRSRVPRSRLGPRAVDDGRAADGTLVARRTASGQDAIVAVDAADCRDGRRARPPCRSSNRASRSQRCARTATASRSSGARRMRRRPSGCGRRRRARAGAAAHRPSPSAGRRRGRGGALRR